MKEIRINEDIKAFDFTKDNKIYWHKGNIIPAKYEFGEDDRIWTANACGNFKNVYLYHVGDWLERVDKEENLILSEDIVAWAEYEPLDFPSFQEE